MLFNIKVDMRLLAMSTKCELFSNSLRIVLAQKIS